MIIMLPNALTTISMGYGLTQLFKEWAEALFNIATEDLLCEINHIYKFKYNLELNFNLSQNEFKKLKQSRFITIYSKLQFINIYSRIIKMIDIIIKIEI